MAVKFNQRVLHQRIEFLPGVAVAFEDPNGDAYFIGTGWADATDEEPVRTYSGDEVSIDTDTRDAATGKLVLGGDE